MVGGLSPAYIPNAMHIPLVSVGPLHLGDGHLPAIAGRFRRLLHLLRLLGDGEVAVCVHVSHFLFVPFTIGPDKIEFTHTQSVQSDDVD